MNRGAWRCWLVCSLLAIPAGATLRAEAPPRLPVLGLGYEYDLSGAREEFLLPDPLEDPSIAADHPLYVRLRVPWSLLEPRSGEYDWSEADRVVDPYRAARFVVILCLYGPNAAVDPQGSLPAPGSPTVLKSWLDFTRAAAAHFKGRVRYYEIGDEPNRVAAWSGEKVADYAYVLKNTSVTIRSVDPGALIVGGGLAISAATLDADIAWQKALYAQDTATYVDVLSIHPAADTPFASCVARAYDAMLADDPSSQLWANSVPLSGASDRERAADLLAKFVAGQGEGASLVTFDLEADVEGRPEFPGVLLDIHRLFLPTYSRVTGGGLRFEPSAPGGEALPRIEAYRFFDAGAFEGLVGFSAARPPADGKARLVLDTAAVRGVAVYDIVGGAAGPIRGVEPDFKSNTTRVPVVVYERTQIVQYARVPIKGFEAEKEEVQIQGTGLITAEEVIAGHQAFMADQNFRLKHYRADARLTYHGKLEGSDTLDITFDNAFYLDRSTGAEWEQRALYYNGVRWKGKKLPELPIPQPEKVFTLPLDINLNKDYTYAYQGREKVGEFDCYVIAFRPIDPSRTLYEGKAWIETRTFAPVKMATVQTNLKPPVVSNDEKDYFLPQVGPDGTTFWLLGRVEGQQIVSFAGRNIVLLREILFDHVRINDPDFDRAKQDSYASAHPMLRDTDQGLRYLEPTGNGARTVKEPTRSALLGLAALYRQTGLDYPVLPLVGVEYFNFKFRGREGQFNALLGALVNLVTFTNPGVAGSHVDASGEFLTFLPQVTDRLFIRGKEREASDVRTRSQRVSGSLGRSLGNFFRLKGTLDLEYTSYDETQETDSFVLPRDTFVQTGGLEGEFNRSAWTINASAQRGRRQRWAPWGDTSPAGAATAAEFPSAPCDSPGSCLTQFDPAQKSYDLFQFGVVKEVFLPAFQKLRFEANWMTGARLDRFSEYQFSFFGDRVYGLSGSGVRFDRGGIARAQYSFNIADIIRFDAGLDYASVRDSLTSDRFDRFTGLGVSGNLMGPWQTVLTFDVGVVVQSDVPDLRGDTEFLAGLLKYF